MLERKVVVLVRDKHQFLLFVLLQWSYGEVADVLSSAAVPNRTPEVSLVPFGSASVSSYVDRLSRFQRLDGSG